MEKQLSKDLGQLSKRGIRPSTLAKYDLTESEGLYGAAKQCAGLRFFTIDTNGRKALRWRVNDDQKDKYPERFQWATVKTKTKEGKPFENPYVVFGKLDSHLFYSFGGLSTAIPEDGTLYWDEGEVDVWTDHSALVDDPEKAVNAIHWYGRLDQLPEAITFLQGLGVKKIIQFPDADAHGFQHAFHVMTACKGVGMPYEAYRLPGKFGTGYDKNDLYKYCGYDGEKYKIALAECQPIPESELMLWGHDSPTGERMAHEGTLSNEWWQKTRQEWVKKLIELLGKADKRSAGNDYWHCPLPHHDDKHPSFRIADERVPDFPWPVCTCGIQHHKDAWEQIGQVKGLTFEQFYTPLLPTKPDKKSGNSNGASPSGQNVPLEDIFVDMDDAAREFLQTIQPGYVPTTSPPIQNPIKSLHSLGGMARIMEAGKFWIIVGGSGTGKTNYLESLVIEPLLMDGYGLITAGGEWKPKEVIARRAHRHGGVSRTDYLVNQLLRDQKARNVPQEKQASDGEISAEDFKRTENIVNATREWPGKHIAIPKSAIGIVAMVDAVRRKVLDSKFPIRILIIDYLQMYLHNLHMPFMEQLWYLKNNLEPSSDFPGMVIIGASQVTKQAAKALRSKNKDLDSADIQEIREDPANLVTTLQPEFLRVGGLKTSPIIGYKPYGWVRSSKNSEGRPGSVCMGMDLGQLRWIDCIVDPEAENEGEMPF